MQMWQGGNGRWYVRRYAGGNATDANSYAHASSAYRKARLSWPGLPVVRLRVRPA